MSFFSGGSFAKGGGGFIQNSFNPSRLPGIKLWLDASDSSTITLNGSKVSQWNDKSGNSKNVVNATDANRPTIQTANLNGKNTIFFGTSQWLDGGANLIASGDTGFDLFVLIKLSDLTATRTFFEVGPVTQTAGKAYRALDLSTGEMYFSDIGNDRQTVPGVITVNTWCLQHFEVLPGVFSAADPNFYKNNVLQTSSGGTGTGTPNIQPDAFRVGARMSGSAGDSLAYIAEVIAVEGTVSSSDRANVYNYLQSKWNF